MTFSQKNVGKAIMHVPVSLVPEGKKDIDILILSLALDYAVVNSFNFMTSNFYHFLFIVSNIYFSSFGKQNTNNWQTQFEI